MIKPKTVHLFKRIIIDSLMYSILVVSLFPIAWMIITSLKSNYDILLGRVGFSRMPNNVEYFYPKGDTTYFTTADGIFGKYEKKNASYSIINNIKGLGVSSLDLGEKILYSSAKELYLLDKTDNPIKENVYQTKNVPWKIIRKVRNTVIAQSNNKYFVGKIVSKTKEEEDKKYSGQEVYEGLMVFDKNFKYKTTINDPDLILNSNISTLLADGNNLWIGSSDGVTVYNTLSQTAENIFSSQEVPGIIEVRKIISDENFIWVASSTHIYKVQRYSSNLQDIKFKVDIPEINTIFKNQNLLYIGTTNGLYVFDIIKNSVKVLFSDKAKFWNVKSIYETGNELWLGLDNGEIKKISNNGSFEVQSSYALKKGSLNIRWENYLDMWENISFGIYLKNSIIICVITVIIALFLSTTAGYALSRFRFPGSSIFSSSILAVNMIPPLLILIPIYLMYIKFNDLTGIKLVGTYPGIIALYATWFIPMSIWILRSFFIAIPVEIEEAARIDGCNRFQVFWKIALPLAMPGIIATGIYIFLIAWDELIFATILLPQKEMLTIPLGIKLYIGNHQNRFDLMMAAATIATLPVLIMFLAVQRWFIKGLTAGAVKG